MVKPKGGDRISLSGDASNVRCANRGESVRALKVGVDPEERAALIKERDELRAKASQINDQMLENNNMLELLAKKEVIRGELATELEEAEERIQNCISAEEEKRRQVKEQEQRISDLQRELEIVACDAVKRMSTTMGEPQVRHSISAFSPLGKAKGGESRKGSILGQIGSFSPAKSSMRKMSVMGGGVKDFIKRRFSVAPQPTHPQLFQVPPRDSEQSVEASASATTSMTSEAFLVPGQVQGQNEKKRFSFFGK